MLFCFLYSHFLSAFVNNLSNTALSFCFIWCVPLHEKSLFVKLLVYSRGNLMPLFNLEGFSYKPAAFVTTTFHVTTHHLLPTFLYILLKTLAQPPSSLPPHPSHSAPSLLLAFIYITQLFLTLSWPFDSFACPFFLWPNFAALSKLLNFLQEGTSCTFTLVWM